MSKIKYFISILVIGLLFAATSTSAQMGQFSLFKLVSDALLPLNSAWELGSEPIRIAKLWLDDLDTTNITIGGVSSGDIDMNSNIIKNIGHTGTDFVASTGALILAGDLTITGDHLFMATNTVGAILVGDNTNFNPVVMGGDVSIAADGTVTIGSDKILEGMLKSVNSPTDEYYLTYESTTGDFEWQDVVTVYARSSTKVVCASDSIDTTNCDYVCDGTADEVQIQEAIDAVNTGGVGGTVKLMEGTYNIDTTPIDLETKISLEGNGLDTILVANGAGLTKLINIDSSGGHWKVKNLTLDGNGQENIYGITEDTGISPGEGWEIAHCFFDDWDGASTAPINFGATSLNDVYFLHHNVFDHTLPIEIGTGYGGMISNNSWHYKGGIWIDTADTIISNNSFTYMAELRLLTNSDRCIVSGNNFYEYTKGIDIGGGDYHIITGNVVNDSLSVACIDFGAKTHITIVGNNLSDCATYGIVGTGDYAFVAGNHIYDCTTALTNITGVHSQVFNNGTDVVSEKKLAYMTNTDGDAMAAGDLVILKSVAAGNEVTHTTTGGDDAVYGMAVETIANAASGYIQTLGKTTALKVNGTDDIAIGDFICTFTSEGIGKKCGTGDMAIAIALEVYTTDDSAGVIDALLVDPKIVEVLTSVAYGDLTGNPSDVITAGNNISWSNDTLNVDDAFVLTGGDEMTGNLTFDVGTVTIAGIQNQNLVDKADTETISGVWTFSDNVKLQKLAAPKGYWGTVYSDNSGAQHYGYLVFNKSHQDTEGYTVTIDDEILGSISGCGVGSDANSFDAGADIYFVQQGAAGAANIPGSIEFWTGTNAAIPAVALTINSDKSATFAGDVVLGDDQNLWFNTSKTIGLRYDTDDPPTGVTVSDNLILGDDQYLYFDTAKSDAYLRFSDDHSTLVYGGVEDISFEGAVKFHANTGADGSGAWEPNFELGSGGDVTLENTSTGDAGRRYFYINMTDGIQLQTGGTGLQAIILADNIATADKTFQFPNFSGTFITSGNLADITTVGTIGTGTWQGNVIDHERGGIEADISAIVKGGLLVGTGDGTMGIETVGTNDQVLTADSTSEGGVKWADAAGGGSVGGTYGINVETLTDNKTLTANTNKIYQYLDEGGSDRIITLATTDAVAGDRFVIRHNGIFQDNHSLEVKQSTISLDKIYTGAIKEYIFDGTDWISGEAGTGEDGTKQKNLSIGSNTKGYDYGIAIGYFAEGYSKGIGIGYYTDGYNGGVAIGYSAVGHTDGVGIGSSADGANYSVAVGYSANTNDKKYSIALGYKSETERVGELSLNINGDDTDQENNIIIQGWEVETANATPVEMLAGGQAGERFIIRASSSVAFRIMITARDNVAGHVASYIAVEGLIVRDGANNTTMPVPATITTVYEDDAGWDINVTADDGNEALIITVTGDDTNATQWVARMDAVETHF